MRSTKRIVRRGTRALLALFLGLAPAGAGASSAAAANPEAIVDRVFKDPRLDQPAGLTRSILHPGVLWTHNDSPVATHLYAVGADGKTVAWFNMKLVAPAQWEGITAARPAGLPPSLYVADIGDDGAPRRNVRIYRVSEPKKLVDADVPTAVLNFRFADEPQEAEAMLVHPDTGRIYVITAGDNLGNLYAGPAKASTKKMNVFTRIGDAPANIGDATFLPSGLVVARTDERMYVASEITELVNVEPVGLPDQEDGESIAPGDAEGKLLLVNNDIPNSEVLRFPVPEQLLPADQGGPGEASPSLTVSSGAPPAVQESQNAGLAGNWVRWAFIPVLLLLAGALLLHSRSGSRHRA